MSDLFWAVAKSNVPDVLHHLETAVNVSIFKMNVGYTLTLCRSKISSQRCQIID